MSHHPERTARNVRPVNQPPSYFIAASIEKAGRSRICLSDNGKILKADCGFGLDDSKSSDALLLRCSDAEVGQDRASGVDRVHEDATVWSLPIF